MRILLNRYKIILPIIALALQVLPTTAQERTPPTVVSVEVAFEGFKNISEQYVRGNIKIKVGDEYDQAIVDDSVKSLYRTGLFEFIDVDVNEATPATVGIVFNVKPKYRVENVYFEGNDKASDRRLLQEISIRRGQFIDEYNIKTNADKIEEYYIKRGFSNIEISYDIERNETNGLGIVTYTVNEGKKIKIADIEFIGNEQVKKRKLRGEMETKKWSWISWLTGNGKFDDDEFRESHRCPY